MPIIKLAGLVNALYFTLSKMLMDNYCKADVTALLSVLKDGYHMIIDFKVEGRVNIITLSNPFIKISFIEEYQPNNLYVVHLYDGEKFWIGLPVLYKYKNIEPAFDIEQIHIKDFGEIASFLAEHYKGLLSGSEESKDEVWRYYLSLNT